MHQQWSHSLNTCKVQNITDLSITGNHDWNLTRKGRQEKHSNLKLPFHKQFSIPDCYELHLNEMSLPRHNWEDFLSFLVVQLLLTKVGQLLAPWHYKLKNKKNRLKDNIRIMYKLLTCYYLLSVCFSFWHQEYVTEWWYYPGLQMNTWKIIYLNCGERYGIMIYHCSYTHN